MKSKLLVWTLISILFLSSCWLSNESNSINPVTWKGSTISNESINENIEKEQNNEQINLTIVTDNFFVWNEQYSLDELIKRIKWETFLSSANIEILNYSQDEKAKEIMKSNNLELLPQVILDTNKLNDNWAMSNYLTQKNDIYLLEIWAFYNPETKEIVDPNKLKGQLLTENLEFLKNQDDLILSWKKDSKYSIYIFSDFDCPYCKTSIQSGSIERISENLSDEINLVYKNFPLKDIHPNSENKSLSLLKRVSMGEDLITTLKDIFNSSSEVIFTEGEDLSIEKDKLEKEIKLWEIFDIKWTPTIIIVNKGNWKYISITEELTWSDFNSKIEELN